jgi:hypothetical protein
MLRIVKPWTGVPPTVVAVCLVLLWAVLPAGPAAAAPCGTNCYQYQADITVTGWVSPMRVIPGGTHLVTVQVTNTGWRTGGNSAPRPWIGPNSGEVYVTTHPSTTAGQPLADFYDGGVDFTPCWNRSGDSLTCFNASMPTGATGQYTLVYRAPATPGTYTYLVAIDSHRWTEYDENNNRVVLTYEVGY